MEQISINDLSMCMRKIKASNPWPMKPEADDEISGLFMSIDSKIAIEAARLYELEENPPKNIMAAIRGIVRGITDRIHRENNNAPKTGWKVDSNEMATFSDYHAETLKVRAMCAKSRLYTDPGIDSEGFEEKARKYLQNYKKRGR